MADSRKKGRRSPATRLIVAITGASGAIYGIRTMQLLKAAKVVETHLVISASAARTIKEETRHTLAEVRALADHCHDQRDIGAAIASGSFLTSGLLVAPCSVRTLSCIAHGNSGELIARTADVCLKERRRVVLLFRETPLHAGHIEIMSLATRSGAVIMPPVPAFYFRPETIEEIVDQTIGRALDLFDIEIGVVHRWRDPPS